MSTGKTLIRIEGLDRAGVASTELPDNVQTTQSNHLKLLRMKVIFQTNIDHYQTNCFPSNIDTPPRIGETVLVTEVFRTYYAEKRLPTRLEVVDVTWTDKGVLCELWYKKIDVEASKLSGVKLL